MFSASAYVDRGRVDLENRNGTRKGPMVVEKTEKKCAPAQNEEGRPAVKIAIPYLQCILFFALA
jgi:hypothetical protein